MPTCPREAGCLLQCLMLRSSVQDDNSVPRKDHTRSTLLHNYCNKGVWETSHWGEIVCNCRHWILWQDLETSHRGEIVCNCRDWILWKDLQPVCAESCLADMCLFRIEYLCGTLSLRGVLGDWWQQHGSFPDLKWSSSFILMAMRSLERSIVCVCWGLLWWHDLGISTWMSTGRSNSISFILSGFFENLKWCCGCVEHQHSAVSWCGPWFACIKPYTALTWASRGLWW